MLIGKTYLHLHFSKKHTYTKIIQNCLPFPAEMDTSGCKTPTFVPFHTNFDYQGRLSVKIKTCFGIIPCTILCYDPNMFSTVQDLLTNTF